MKTSDQDKFESGPQHPHDEPLIDESLNYTHKNNDSVISEDLLAEAQDEMPDIGRRV
jgi:MFS family permease